MIFKNNIKLPVEVSARHCHLSEKDIEALFGKGHQLTKLKQLSQPSDFACQETITVYAGSKKFENVRVVGPARSQSQVEISMSDAVGSGLEVPLRLSGDVAGSAPMVLEGPKGQVGLSEGLIIARRHLHCSAKQAEELGLRNGQLLSVEIKGQRSVSFHCVEVRVKDNYNLILHLDTDEGNAAGISKMGEGALDIFSAN